MNDTALMIRTREAAARAGVHPETIRRWVAAGRLPAIRTLGGQLRVDSRTLERLLALHVEDQP